MNRGKPASMSAKPDFAFDPFADPFFAALARMHDFQASDVHWDGWRHERAHGGSMCGVGMPSFEYEKAVHIGTTGRDASLTVFGRILDYRRSGAVSRIHLHVPVPAAIRAELAGRPAGSVFDHPALEEYVIRNAREENGVVVMEIGTMRTNPTPNYRPFPRRDDEGAAVPDFADMTPAERTLVMETLALFTSPDDGPAQPPVDREELLRALPPGELPEGSVAPLDDSA